MTMGEGPVIPDGPPPELHDTADEILEQSIQAGVQARRLGELLSHARARRKVGKRELARRLQTSHSRIGQLESARNLELKSVFEFLAWLDYDVIITAAPHEGGEGVSLRIPAQQGRLQEPGPTGSP